MNKIKVALCGLLLASAAWIPGFANGLDEAMQVTSDPYVAYTLYKSMPITEAIETFDTLPDWTKHTEYIKDPHSNGPAPLVYFYTRILSDKTKQVLIFKKYDNQTKLSAFALLFYTKNAQDAIKMYEQAYQNIDSYQKWTKVGDIKSKHATFWNDDKDYIEITVNSADKLFFIKRYSTW